MPTKRKKSVQTIPQATRLANNTVLEHSGKQNLEPEVVKGDTDESDKSKDFNKPEKTIPNNEYVLDQSQQSYDDLGELFSGEKTNGHCEQFKEGDVEAGIILDNETTKNVSSNSNLHESDNARKNWQKLDPKEIVAQEKRNKNSMKNSSTLHIPGDASVTELDRDAELGARSVASTRASSRVSLLSNRSEEFLFKLQQASVVLPVGADEKPKKVLLNNDSFIRSAIPTLPLWLAVVCFMLNVMAPGTGTILSGLSSIFCGRSRLQSQEDTRQVMLCTNVWIGIAQLMTVTFLLVGWFWSMAWGLKMIFLSVEQRKEDLEKSSQERKLEVQAIALSVLTSPQHTKSKPTPS